MGPGAEKLQNVWRYEDEEAAADGDLDEANSSHVQLCTTGNYWDGFPHDTSHITRCLRSGHGKKQSRLLAGSRQQFHNNTSPAAAARTPARDGHISSLKEIWQG